MGSGVSLAFFTAVILEGGDQIGCEPSEYSSTQCAIVAPNQCTSNLGKQITSLFLLDLLNIFSIIR